MTHDEPIRLKPARRVLLRDRSNAAITHFVSGPEPFELLGRIDDGAHALWTRKGRFTPGASASPLDIVAIEIGGAWAPFAGIEIKS